MSRSRMFGDDEDAPQPSPRTTIVGGRPPEGVGRLPPVPTGIQRLLRLASVDEAFRRELVERRAAAAPAASVELTATEKAVLAAIPAAQLLAMAEGLPPPDPERRTFLRQTAASAVLLLGGAALSSALGERNAGAEEPACTRSTRAEMATTGGAAPDLPRVPEPGVDSGGFSPLRSGKRSSTDKGGARPDEPPPPRPGRREMEDDGGAAPDEPPPRAHRRDMETEGGAAPRPPRPIQRPRDAGRAADGRPPEPPKVQGIRPDVPPSKAPSQGPPELPPKAPSKPIEPGRTRGHRADIPPLKSPVDPRQKP